MKSVQPDQNKRKPTFTVILIFFLLLSAISAGYLIYKYKTELSKQAEIKKTEEITKAHEINNGPFPRINTFELPPAKVGIKFLSEVFATLANTNGELSITITGLPDGLTLGKCDQKFDSEFIPSPNTLAKCVVEGTPDKAGTYHLKLSAFGNGFTAINTIDLTVTAP